MLRSAEKGACGRLSVCGVVVPRREDVPSASGVVISGGLPFGCQRMPVQGNTGVRLTGLWS